MELSQGSKELLSLTKGAYKGEVMLPDFQRNFVWARQDIEELIKSLLEDMFIGNFLIHNVNPLDPPFKPIPIEGAIDVNPSYSITPNILILDGQQRISSIFYALYAPNIPLKNASNPYVFFIKIHELIKDDIDNCVFSTSKEWRYYKSLLNEEKDYDIEKLVAEQIIPMTLLVDDFTEIWFEHYKENYSNEDEKKVRSYIKNIINYNALTLDVPINEKPENIAVLFERINRTGIKLSVFDLLVARLYKYINLRDLWEKSFEENSNIQIYANGDKRNTTIPYYFIQALALNSGLSIKAREMLKLNGETLTKSAWDDLINIVENDVLVRLLDINEYGVGKVEKWMPYSTMIVPYLAFFMLDNYHVEKINKWYWASVFGERYASSVESRITKDYKEVVTWFSSDLKVPEVVTDINDSISRNIKLKDKANSGNSVYKGVFNLLFKNEAKDFYENDKLKYKNSDLEDHHIFPKKFLEDKGIYEYVNCILNRTLIHGKTNNNIRKKAPGDYLKIMIANYKSEEKVISILSKHFIDKEMFLIMQSVHEDSDPDFVSKQFVKFINKREELIINAIERLV